MTHEHWVPKKDLSESELKAAQEFLSGKSEANQDKPKTGKTAQEIYEAIEPKAIVKPEDLLDFLRNKIWYNSSMNYEASKQLTDVRFKRLVGVQRTTFEEMLAVLKTAYQRKHAKGGRTPKLSLEDLLMATLQYMR
ncbi:TPA: pneumococcal-type histidine triad protein, partial [Streptococcus agalactiae]